MTETILRCWTGRIRTADEAAYTAYIRKTGLDDYGATPGNLGSQMLMRSLGDGTSEVTTLSWWTSMAAIEAFAGADVDKARYYPQDDAFLIGRPEHVAHHRLVAGAVAPTD
jgi:heme-degrading monooxygenase HmoA